MTSAKIWYIINICRNNLNKKVRLVYDTAPSRCGKAVIDYTSKWNDNHENSSNFFVESIDPSLTSVYQPLNIMYN